MLLERDAVLIRGGPEEGERACLFPPETAVHGMLVGIAEELGAGGPCGGLGARS